MDREILYRGKIKGSNTGYKELDWVFGNFVKELETGRCFIVDLAHFDENTKLQDVMIEVDPETVCQYTGLTDKNGRKIFEGDIVGFEDCTSTESGYWEQYCSGEVEWSNEEAQFCVTNRLMAESYEVLQDCEVIGNIFDNPESMEGGRS